MLVNSEKIRVRYSETDQLKIVYYSRYLEYFEVGRLSLLREYGFPYNEMEAKQNYHLPVLESHAIYHRPARLEDVLTITTSVKEKPAIRLKFDYEIYCGEILLATGYTVHAFFNGVTCKPCRPPKGIKEMFDMHFPG